MLARPATRTIRLRGPLDLRATLGSMVTGRGDPTWRLDDGEAWRAQTTAEGPATLHLRLAGDALEATSWGPGADRVLERAPALVGELDERGDFDARPHPIVHRMDRTHPGLRWGASGSVVATAIATVLGQRVTSGEHMRSWRSLVMRWVSLRPAPAAILGLRTPPTASELRRLPYAAFHPLGVERGRAETIRRICSHSTRLDRLSELPKQEAWTEAARVLPLIAGIGPWTESIVRGTALGDPDAAVVGDLHIPHHVCHSLEGTDRGSDERMLELLAPFAGHRGRAQRLALRAGSGAPRRGPRYSPLPIARM